jgi:Arc/MetJ-type ribon-helix-helix transcriptional regulator
MKDTMVSIRMPEALAKELEQQAVEEHFLDLSEFIRSIVRKEWLQRAKPDVASELQSLRKRIETELSAITRERVQKEVAAELRKIQEQLKRGGS